MISVTLNFKSIEAARNALLDIPQSDLVGGPEAEVAQETKPAAKSAPKEQKAKTSPAAEPTAREAPAAQPASTPDASKPVDYPALQKAVFALAGKSREAAAAVAASMGVKTFKELDESKWAEALAAVNAKLAELGA